MDWRLNLRNAALRLSTLLLLGVGGVAVGLPLRFSHPTAALVVSVAGMGLLTALWYDPLRRTLQPALDRLLFADRYSYLEAFGQLPNDLLEFTNLREMLRFLVTRLTEAAQLKRVRVFMYDSGRQAYVEMIFRGSPRPGDDLAGSADRQPSRALEISDSSALVQWLREEGRLWTAEDLSTQSSPGAAGSLADLRKLDGAACFPINKENDLMGLVILGPKRSNEPFNPHDLKILGILRRQLENFLTQAMVLTQEALNMVKDSHSMKNDVNALKGRISWRALRMASWKIDFEEEMARLEKWLTEAGAQLPAASRAPLAQALAALKERSSGFLADSQRSLPIEENAISRLAHHVKNWAEFGRVVAEGFRGRRPFEVVDVGQTLRLSVDRWKPMAEGKNLDLSAEVPGPLFIWGERRLLEQIVENLIDNALKATSHGFVLVACRKERDDIEIEVRDTGCGIPENDLAAIFDKPFYQRLGQGKLDQSTGIGLYLVAQYARSLGGRVAVESHLGKGSTFRVLLPEHKAEKRAVVAA